MEKSSGTLYWRSTTGDVLAETDASGDTKNEYVYFAGQRIAWWDSAENPYYIYADSLGSTRTIAEANGTVCYDSEFTPYGQEINHTSSCPSTYNYKFTGYERDSETGLDYAVSRYYSSRLGRFMSADPLGGSLSDPQSLNRYAYVGNNPANFVDPSGLMRKPCISRDPAACINSWNQDGGCTVDNVASDCSDPLFALEFDTGALTLVSGDLNPGMMLQYVPGLVPVCHDWDSQGCSEVVWEPGLIASGVVSVVPNGGGPTGTPQTPQKPPCAVPSGKHLSMGVSVNGATVNPLTSGGGVVLGGNQQSFGATTYNYTYSGAGAGLDVGASVQSVWAYGSGSWTGPFQSINVSLSWFTVSIFRSTDGAWHGFTFGLGVGAPGASYEVTNYTCRSGPSK